MSEEERAKEAAGLYAAGDTFSDIAEKLEIAKSFAQTLVRKGISLMEETEQENETPEQKNETPPHQGAEGNPSSFQGDAFPISDQLPIRMPSSFMVETVGIPKRVLLTPKCLMIFDLWRGAGFTGDFSDFLEDAVNFLYESKRPAER